jgi:hypothetical protein
MNYDHEPMRRLMHKTAPAQEAPREDSQEEEARRRGVRFVNADELLQAPEEGWRKTLRFEDAPDFLDTEEAATLARLGKTGSAIYELIKFQDARLSFGEPVPNRLPYIRFNRRILIPKQALREWLLRESELSGGGEAEDAAPSPTLVLKGHHRR